MNTYIFGPVLSLLPGRWRSSHLRDFEVDWTRATLISGIAEALFALAALVVWYSVFVERLAPVVGPYVGGSNVSGYVGLFSLLGHPLTWLILYLCLEGPLRAAAAIATEEAPGSLPLVALDWAFGRARRKRMFTQLVPDEVTIDADTGAMTIASCRPKLHWKYPLSIRYQDEFFQITGEKKTASHGAAERPFLYLLRRLPANEIIRGLEPYDPTNVLDEESQPRFLSTVAGELRKRSAK